MSFGKIKSDTSHSIMKDLKKKLKELKDLMYENVVPFTLDEFSAMITRINEMETVLKQKQNGKTNCNKSKS